MRAEKFYMLIETTEAKRGDYERLRQIFLPAFFYAETVQNTDKGNAGTRLAISCVPPEPFVALLNYESRARPL